MTARNRTPGTPVPRPISRYFPRVSEKLVLAAASEELLRAPPRQVDADGQADFVRGFPADPGGRFAAETRHFQSLMAGEEGQDHSDFAQLAHLSCIQWLQARDRRDEHREGEPGDAQGEAGKCGSR
eukprot:Skav217707  [mRNA]  locus=scaffold2294:138870:140455:- [translate_table: standard]